MAAAVTGLTAEGMLAARDRGAGVGGVADAGVLRAAGGDY